MIAYITHIYCICSLTFAHFSFLTEIHLRHLYLLLHVYVFTTTCHQQHACRKYVRSTTLIFPDTHRHTHTGLPIFSPADGLIPLTRAVVTKAKHVCYSWKIKSNFFSNKNGNILCNLWWWLPTRDANIKPLQVKASVSNGWMFSSRTRWTSLWKPSSCQLPLLQPG